MQSLAALMRRVPLRPAAAFALRLTVLVLCLWFVSLQINLADFGQAIRTLDLKWAAVAVLLAMLQIPVAGMRWAKILDSLSSAPLPRIPIIAIAAIGAFFAQVMPTVTGEGIRLWLLSRLGTGWRIGLQSLVIDRGVGVLMLLTFGLVALFMPSALAALGGVREPVILVFGVTLAAALVAIVFAKHIGSFVSRWPLMGWFAAMANAAHQTLIESPKKFAIVGLAATIHMMTITVVWSLARAQGLDITFSDSAVLFTVMVGGALIAISIAGWGVREVIVLLLLQGHGVPTHQAVFFSISFGLCVLAASLPGLIIWMFYVPAARKSPS